MSRVHNFCAGPCTLPEEVLRDVQSEFLDFEGSGMSLIELSHRSPQYEAVHDDARLRLRTVFEIPDDFEILFVQGGATLQFATIPLNLLRQDSAAYVVSGAWGKAALADATRCGAAYTAWDGSSLAFKRMPEESEIHLRGGTRYLHVTSNETIEGLALAGLPDVGVPLVVDISSDFLSRPLAWDLIDVAYGGAQKNLGPAGLGIVIVRRNVLAQCPTELASYLSLFAHAGAGSMLNTPPMFSIYVMGRMLKWIEGLGGLAAMQRRAVSRSASIYQVIDESGGFYRGRCEPSDRSRQNVVFGLSSADEDDRFLAAATSQGLVNLRGHRSVGGLRASIYNGMPDAGVAELAAFMRAFAQAP